MNEKGFLRKKALPKTIVKGIFCTPWNWHFQRNKGVSKTIKAFSSPNWTFAPSDEERLAAKEELKVIVKNFLLTESKKIEGTVETQVKTVVDALNTKIDVLTDVPKGKEEKGKKGK